MRVFSALPRSLRMMRIALSAALCGVLVAAVPARAQDFAPAVIVNDSVVTNFDVMQRMRILRAAGGGAADEAALRGQAIETLIEDALRLQGAKRFGIVPDKAQIDAGFDELARQNGRDGDAMRSFFASNGVSAQALEYQVAAEVAWRELVRQRYTPRVRVSDAEIDEAIASVTGPDETQYLLAEIRLPIGGRGEQAVMAEAQQLLVRLSRGEEFSGIAQRVSQGPTASVGGDLGWVSESNLSPTFRTVVSRMSADRVSPPFVDGGDVVMVGLRSIREPGNVVPTRYRLSQIVVGAPASASQAQADAAYRQALAARARLSDCASVEAVKADYLPISGSLGEVTGGELPGPVREAVARLETGGISEPIRSNDGFHIIVVCDKAQAEGPSGAELRERARTVLTARKLSRYARSLLNDLKREAVIERR